MSNDKIRRHSAELPISPTAEAAGSFGALMGDDELDELYEVKPEEFTALRTKLVATAKKRGDTSSAKRISAARRPTRRHGYLISSRTAMTTSSSP